jgi:two-component system, NtrC family, sensor kinase
MAAMLAPELHSKTKGPIAEGTARNPSEAFRSPFRPMAKDFTTRFSAVLLGLLTVIAVTFAWINFNKEQDYQIPYDGVWWVDAQGRIEAQKVDPLGPGARAGLRPGDVLVAINDEPVTNSSSLDRALYRSGIWNKANYSLQRHGVLIQVPDVVLTPADRSMNIAWRLIALIYLGIGIYVLLRRWTAPRSAHFYIFCLVSFIYYAFHYTGKLNDFDQIIYWSNVVAELLLPALFLHFVLAFPETKGILRRHPWLPIPIYLPATVILGVRIAAFELAPASERLRWNLDRLSLLHEAVLFMLAAGVLWHTYKHASTSVLRQQMKWVTRGTTLAILPWLAYVITYLHGDLPGTVIKFSVLSLVLLPLTFGYAIFRYRLMDVDLIFKRGMAYTLAAAAVIGFYFTAVGIVVEIVKTRFPATGTVGLIIAIAVTALLFEPIKNWIQDRLDQFFYHKRYDYRRTLIEFGRELGAQTDLSQMLMAIADRLSSTLEVDRGAIFMAGCENADEFTLAQSFGMGPLRRLDLSFLARQRPAMTAAGHLFFDNTHQASRELPAAQATIAQLDLNYYIPCTVQDRVVAVLGLGKTKHGDYLTSEDVELVVTLARYLGIAIQNARLYESLEQKVQEYERLKDFNQNIVESISVGVLAIDLEDRIEFWNPQMEVMFAKPRSEVLGRPISEIFPPRFAQEFYRMRQNSSIRNLYKFRLDTPGAARITNIAIAPLVTRGFNMIGRLIIVDDITERMELESQLSQAEKMSSIGLLAAGVAHEVNTPLAVISSYAQMLTKELREDEKKSVLLDRINRQVFRASEIVNNLLNFSRTSGTEFGTVDVNKIIQDTLALLEHQLKVSKVQVDQDLAPGLPPIQGNTGKLQQVFLNLFLNARDAMPAGGTLRVATRNGANLNVSISDSGVGIAQDHIHRIYDPFFTTKNAASEGQRRGTGLGLAVTYGIIQEHAGKITVESEAGRGTTFQLEFPLIRKAVNV